MTLQRIYAFLPGVSRNATRPNPMTANPKIIYIGRSRLHRDRANVIQTLHTVAAFQQLGIQAPLYLPSWHGRIELMARLQEFGINERLDIHPVRFLRKSWGLRWFVYSHRHELNQADQVYVRSPEISLALATAGIRHNFEVHTLRSLAKHGQLNTVIAYHRRGIVNRLFPISRTAADMLIEAGAVRDRIHVSPSGVLLEAYEKVTPFNPDHLDRPRVLYVGAISRDRGLNIFTTLATSGLVEIRLVGRQENPIAPQPGLTLQSHVPHRDVPYLYDQADLVLLPYQPALEHADAISPLKLFEAMAAGRPIIASDIGPIRDILTHEVNALLVPPDDIEAWLNAVQRLTRERDLAVRLARNAREEAKHYTWRRRAEGIARALGLYPACTSKQTTV